MRLSSRQATWRAAAAVDTPPCRYRGSATGFTLLELLIVALLLTIVALAAVPSIGGLVRESRMSAAAGQVVNALEFARLTAISTGRPTEVSLHVSAQKITVRQGSPSNLESLLDPETSEVNASDVENIQWTVMEYPLSPGTEYDIKLKNDALFGEAELLAADFASSETVYFGPGGSPSSSGRVDIAIGPRHAIVNLDAITGEVTVRK